MKKLLWIPVSAGLLVVVGCGQNPKTADAPPASSNTSSSASTVANAAPTRAPAAQAQLPSDPKEVVQLFLDSMRQGNGAQLSALMTTAAREEIRRKELVIDPLGSPLATFKIGEAAQQQDAMLVSSVWTEPGEKGEEPSELEVVWELRKEAAGWRVCGMAVDPMTGDEVQVVNFESMEQDPTKAESEPARVASLPNAAPAAQGTASPNSAFPSQMPQGQLPAASFQQTQLPPVQTAPPQGNFALPPASGSLPAGTNGLPPANGFSPR
jgi:hypothetical protein